MPQFLDLMVAPMCMGIEYVVSLSFALTALISVDPLESHLGSALLL